MALELIKTIKGIEKKFLNDNMELYRTDGITYLKRREAFVTKKLEEIKKDE